MWSLDSIFQQQCWWARCEQQELSDSGLTMVSLISLCYVYNNGIYWDGRRWQEKLKKPCVSHNTLTVKLEWYSLGHILFKMECFWTRTKCRFAFFLWLIFENKRLFFPCAKLHLYFSEFQTHAKMYILYIYFFVFCFHRKLSCNSIFKYNSDFKLKNKQYVAVLLLFWF